MKFIKNYQLHEKKKTDDLSGIVLILNEKILLVNPKKFIKSNKLNTWSIPKGRVESYLSDFENAIKELEEETSIVIDKLNVHEESTINYKKGGNKKSLKFWVVYVNKQDLNIKTYNDMILRHFLGKGTEIGEAGFFNYDDASELLEPGQIELLKYIPRKMI